MSYLYDTTARERLQEWLESLFPRDIHYRDKDSSGYYAARNGSGPSPKRMGDDEYRAQIRYYFGAIRPEFIVPKLKVVHRMLLKVGIPVSVYRDDNGCHYLLVDLEQFSGALPTLEQPTEPPTMPEDDQPTPAES